MPVFQLSPVADLVRRLDPELFHTALFASEPGRDRLMVLYAFDIELSRAAAQTSEPMIARMRLQWWRDALAEADAGAPARQHEIAEPMHGLLRNHRLDRADLDSLIEAREAELEGSFDEAQFLAWADGRFGALTRLACALLCEEDEFARRAATAAGQVLAVAYLLRQGMRLAAEANCFLLPGLGPEDRAALARGKVTSHAEATARQHAAQAEAVLHAARAETGVVPKAALPALLPLARAERVLSQARFLFPHEDAPARRGPLLFWRALRGRW
ncbi:MAG: squalene/phytoene synthase family protein [Paracoccaceae bacterium]|nr:squalene/phytoene synthase family protein [Paracoccaceae bacterium]